MSVAGAVSASAVESADRRKCRGAETVNLRTVAVRGAGTGEEAREDREAERSDWRRLRGPEEATGRPPLLNSLQFQPARLGYNQRTASKDLLHVETATRRRQCRGRLRRVPVFAASVGRKSFVYEGRDKSGKLCGPRAGCGRRRRSLQLLVSRHARHARAVDQNGLGLYARRLGPAARI